MRLLRLRMIFVLEMECLQVLILGMHTRIHDYGTLVALTLPSQVTGKGVLSKFLSAREIRADKNLIDTINMKKKLRSRYIFFFAYIFSI